MSSNTIDPRPNFNINPSQRTPCMLVLDASYSMSGQPITQLNTGLTILEEELKSDPTASTRVQVAAVCVGGPAGDARLIQDWTDANDFHAFSLEADHATPLGEGMRIALESIREQKLQYNNHGISYTRPWLFLISDGEPTDEWRAIAEECRKAEQAGEVIIFPIAVEGANLTILEKFSNRGVKQLDGLKFAELFEWLSVSLSDASRSAPGEDVQLQSTDPWAAVSA